MAKKINEGQAIIIALQCIILAAIACLLYMSEKTIVAKESYFITEPIYINPTFEVSEPAAVLEEPIEEYAEPEAPEFSQEDIDLMARVVMSESSILGMDAKRAVAETIVNRVHMDAFPNTVSEVVYQPHQYSTADNGEPNADCYEAVMNAIAEREHPETMVFFRTDYAHTFGTFYAQFGNTYFSLLED